MEQNQALNDLKKRLYQDKPTAYFQHIKKGFAYYTLVERDYHCEFRIPVPDMGDASFYPEMPAQSLIRWMIIPD